MTRAGGGQCPILLKIYLKYFHLFFWVLHSEEPSSLFPSATQACEAGRIGKNKNTELQKKEKLNTAAWSQSGQDSNCCFLNWASMRLRLFQCTPASFQHPSMVESSSGALTCCTQRQGASPWHQGSRIVGWPWGVPPLPASAWLVSPAARRRARCSQSLECPFPALLRSLSSSESQGPSDWPVFVLGRVRHDSRTCTKEIITAGVLHFLNCLKLLCCTMAT